MTIRAMSNAERFNRARKVSALVEFLDFTFETLGYNPLLHSAQIAEAVSRLSKLDWKRAAAKCNQNEPSEISIGQIVELYRRRASSLKVAS